MYDEFLKKFVVLSGKLSIGNPANADMRPLINMDAVNNVNGFVEEAIENGGKNLVVKSVFVPRKDCTNGSYTRPAVIEEAGQKSKLFQEEVFGAMIGAIRVSTKDEFFELANDSKYGLALYLFTKDLVLAQEASEKIRFGELYINMPGPEASQGYHTDFRMTGLAGEGSVHGTAEYVKRKNVYIDYSGKVCLPTFRKSLQ